MEELRDLNKLAKEVVQNYNANFNPSDCKIPQAFKDKVKSLKSFSLVYNDYSVIVKGNGISSKDSFIPNQTFYMASYFIEYSYELSKYRQKVLSIVTNSGIPQNELTSFFTHERDEGGKDIMEGTDKFVKILDDLNYNEKDREYLIKFVTDYTWWSGNKTIERNDFFNSPVLSIMGLSAAANSTMGLIVDYLTQNPDDNLLLLNQVDTGPVKNKIFLPLQQIFFGAPGTGKSYEIKRETEGKEVIRTTFHPDSDYSTFVGAYKPTSREIPVRDVTGKVIIENGEKVTENRIVYEFVEQAFLQAYTKAWFAYANKADGEEAEEQYLVIEEINRGNCAQIFGDLFQLLDRNDFGFSDYPITADKDMKKQLAKAFKGKSIADAERINNIYGKDVVSKVLSGDILLLPDNLYIWATMNTSDQSLFPIDSAFKRRWDWKYIPIKEGMENGVRLGWVIKTKDKKYDWWKFVEKINAEIDEQTKSEDKKLGYFFCKAENGEISAETFVSKVMFYLWNDVFKDQTFATDIFADGDDVLTFKKFYDTNSIGKTIVKEDKVELFLQNLGVEIVENNTPVADDIKVEDYEEEASDDTIKNQRKESLISIQIPNNPTIYSSDSTQFKSFVKALAIIGIDKIIPVVPSLKYRRLGCPVITTAKDPIIETNDKGYTYVQEGDLFIVKGCKHYTYVRILEDLDKLLNIGLVLETK